MYAHSVEYLLAMSVVKLPSRWVLSILHYLHTGLVGGRGEGRLQPQVQVAKAQDKACLDLLNTCMYTYNNIMYKDLGACVT